MNAIEENRVKIVSLDPNMIVDLLNWWRNPPDCIALPITDELPEDCAVLSVNASWQRRCIEVLVASESFPIVETGGLPPEIPGVMSEWRYVPFSEVVEDAIQDST